MIKELPTMPMPEWLANLTVDSIHNDPFPLQLVLQDSLYYPASGFDGDPVAYLAGNLYSYIFVDYAYNREEFNVQLSNQGFKGYEILAQREITQSELTPNGWAPQYPTDQDGNTIKQQYSIKEPFCYWMVFQRSAEFNAEHGPVRFSFIYLCTDGVAGYQALYHSNTTTAKAIAIIQPGTGWGGNWTDFTDPARLFGKTVLDNLAGKPDIFLYGGAGGKDFYKQSCWPRYSEFKGFLGNTSIGIWKKRKNSIDLIKGIQNEI